MWNVSNCDTVCDVLLETMLVNTPNYNNGMELSYLFLWYTIRAPKLVILAHPHCMSSYLHSNMSIVRKETLEVYAWHSKACHDWTQVFFTIRFELRHLQIACHSTQSLRPYNIYYHTHSRKSGPVLQRFHMNKHYLRMLYIPRDLHKLHMINTTSWKVH
jgi:hypothetical protein